MLHNFVETYRLYFFHEQRNFKDLSNIRESRWFSSHLQQQIEAVDQIDLLYQFFVRRSDLLAKLMRLHIFKSEVSPEFFDSRKNSLVYLLVVDLEFGLKRVPVDSLRVVGENRRMGVDDIFHLLIQLFVVGHFFVRKQL